MLGLKIHFFRTFIWLLCLLSITIDNAIPWQAEEETTTEPPPEPVNIRISWRLNQIDYPTCLDYFVVDYYDITYNESTYSRSQNISFAPFLQNTGPAFWTNPSDGHWQRLSPLRLRV